MGGMVRQDGDVQQIKEMIDIVDLVSSYTSLVPSGNRMKGLSPFTNEKTPSFFVDPNEGVYYCFSSQKGGDIFSFVQEVEGVDFKEALAILAERAGVELGNRRPRSPRGDRDDLYGLLETAVATYRELLNEEVRSYLIDRGISDRSIEEWEIGFAPNEWRTITGNRSKEELDRYVMVGLCSRKSDRHFDFFRGRIQFPFRDERGRVIGFSGRAYGDENGAKYINSPEAADPPLFNKSTFLYGLHRAKGSIRKQRAALLTEGPIDAIMAHQAGYPISVATSGTAVTEDHLRQLKRLSGGRLIIVMDGDDAGARATLRAIDLAVSIGMEATDIKAVALPDGKDPADIIADDASAFKRAVLDARTVPQFVIDHVRKTHGDGIPDRMRGVTDLLIPIIAKVRNPMAAEHFKKEAASFCDVSVESVDGLVSRARSESGQETLTVARRAVPSVVRQPDNRRHIDRIAHTVASALSFLGDDAAAIERECADDLQAARAFRPLPDVPREVAVLQYEREIPDVSDRDRLDSVRDTCKDMLKRLCREIRKEQERIRSRGGEKISTA